MTILRNNVTRLLDARKIPYRAFELPPEKLGARETAELLGVDPSVVYKTIVVEREHGRPVLAVIPGDHRVDLKLLASTLGEKKMMVPTAHEAERLTGLLAGGISPLALLHKGFQIVIAEEAQMLDEVHVSGGERGLNLRLGVSDLANLTQASFARISRPEAADS